MMMVMMEITATTMVKQPDDLEFTHVFHCKGWLLYIHVMHIYIYDARVCVVWGGVCACVK